MHSEIDLQQLTAEIQEESRFAGEIMTEVGRVIVGQQRVIQRLLIGVLTQGHVLLEGVPGLAKTLAARTLARTVHATFSRIQFTPDLLPADVTGTLIFDQKTGQFYPRKGPVFANFVLADEVNRAPAKVQSALLEAMQERQVTIGDTTYPLPEPFLIIATQNPIEHEGTYPLPEAQVDRFMLKLKVDYPNRDEERGILDRMVPDPDIPVRAVADPAQILRAREVVRRVYVADRLKDYVVDLIRATRAGKPPSPDLSHLVSYGASPRAGIFLLRSAMAHAFLDGRGFVIPEDVKAVALDVLRHRLILSYEAESEEITSEEIITRVFDAVPVP